jgi:hypothetical protein
LLVMYEIPIFAVAELGSTFELLHVFRLSEPASTHHP